MKLLHNIFEGSKPQPKPGVPQGNDINRDLSSGTQIRLFADDSLLYRVIKDKGDTTTLQNDLNTLQKWEVNWKMEFHPQKCQLLRITNKRKIIQNTYFIHGHPLEETKSAKYLGITIDNKITLKEHINNTIRKEKKTLAFQR